MFNHVMMQVMFKTQMDALKIVCQAFETVAKWVRTVLLLMLCGLVAPSAFAAPAIEIMVGELVLTGISYNFTSVSNPSPISMVFQFGLIQRTGDAPQLMDVYFGVITPNQTLASWVPNPLPDARIMNSQLGLKPLATGVTVATSTTSHALSGFQTAQHAFTSHDPVGMYVVFCLLVATGQDPANPRNWLDIGSKLFFAMP